jgi:hypothetical protein
MSEGTVARLAAIRAHLDTAPRSKRLADKVCILTGVSGIRLSPAGTLVSNIGQATAWLFAHEGARHIYILDLKADGLEELAKAIRDKYPDVKVKDWIIPRQFSFSPLLFFIISLVFLWS